MIQLITSLINELTAQCRESRAQAQALRESFDTIQSLYDEILELNNDNKVMFEVLDDDIKADREKAYKVGKEVLANYEVVRSGPGNEIKAFYPLPKANGGDNGK